MSHPITRSFILGAAFYAAYGFTGAFGRNLPKGPFRTKSSTESKVTTAREKKKNATAIAKRYGECSEVLVFLGKKRQENGTESQKLRR